MSRALVEALEHALADKAQEQHNADASVMVQFATGDWPKVLAALKAARAELDAPPPPVESPTPAKMWPEPDVPSSLKKHDTPHDQGKREL